MHKNELQNGMVVKSSDGRYGVVCIKDETDIDCIKFLYDPNMRASHGSVANNSSDFVIPLSCFTDDLLYLCSEQEADELGIQYSENLSLWGIQEVYSLKKEWRRMTCASSCGHLSICKETYDKSPVGCCKLKNNFFVGTMDEIHNQIAPCIAHDEYMGISKRQCNDFNQQSQSTNLGDTRRF
jgi:hypothetical protein